MNQGMWTLVFFGVWLGIMLLLSMGEEPLTVGEALRGAVSGIDYECGTEMSARYGGC